MTFVHVEQGTGHSYPAEERELPTKSFKECTLQFLEKM
jgi:hypothetical protein